MRKLIVVFVLAVSCATTKVPQERSVRYTFIRAGDVAGHAVTTIKSGGERDYAWDFNDRGRGPKMTATVRFDDRHLPVSLKASGNDYFKNPVTEEFRIENGVARWSDTVEHGDAKVTGPAMYLSMYALPLEEVGNLVQVALASPDRCIALYPGGRACVEHVLDLSGRRLYSISGLGFEPAYVWLGSDGQFFGGVSSWFSEIREGHESEIQELVKAQDDAIAARHAAMSHDLRHRPSGTLLIRNARLFDPATLSVRDGMSVLVDGKRIARVSPDAEMNAVAGETIDAGGRMLLPGLWDMHVHYDPTEGVLNLAAGVTTARDMGNDFATIVRARKDIDEGTTIGPHLLIAGFVDGSGPYRAPAGEVVESEEQARAAIDKFAGAGFVQVKVYSSMKPELVPFITEYAHSKGMRVSGHVPAGMFADDVVRIGWNEIQHVNMLFLNFYRDVLNTNTPVRFTVVADRGADLDVDSPQVQEFIGRLRDHHVVVDETLATFEPMFVGRPGEIPPTYAPIADRLPSNVRRGLLTGNLPYADETAYARHAASYQRMIDFVNRLYRGGVTLVTGTDGLAGFLLHRELELLVKAGIPAPEVLRMATLGDARVMHRDDSAGSIEAGKVADMILVDGDPTKNISDIRRVVTTIKDGDVYDAAKLYAAVGVRN